MTSKMAQALDHSNKAEEAKPADDIDALKARIAELEAEAENNKKAGKAESNQKPSGKIRYKNIGGNHYLPGGKVIKRGETFLANPKDIAAGFKNKFIATEDIPEPEPLKSATKFEISKDLGGGWYNVANKETGKIINDKKLRKDAAIALALQFNE